MTGRLEADVRMHSLTGEVGHARECATRATHRARAGGPFERRFVHSRYFFGAFRTT